MGDGSRQRFLCLVGGEKKNLQESFLSEIKATEQIFCHESQKIFWVDGSVGILETTIFFCSALELAHNKVKLSLFAL